MIVLLVWLFGTAGCGEINVDVSPSPTAESSTAEPISDGEWIVISVFSADDASAEIFSASAAEIRRQAVDNEYYKIDPEGNLVSIDQSGKTVIVEDGVCRIGSESSKRVFKSLLEFICSPGSIGEVLHHYSVEGSPGEVIVFSVIGYPLMLRVWCGNAYCFISVEQDPEKIEVPSQEDYSFSVYSETEFGELIGSKKLTVYYKGENVPGCDARLYGEYVRISIMGVLKLIDEDASLTEKDGLCVLTLMGSEYIVYPDQHKITSIDSGANLIIVPPGDFGFCQLRGGDLYLDRAAFCDILRLSGANAIFDFDNMTVMIVKP